MPVNVNSISKSEFDILLENLLTQLEDKSPTPYQDSAKPITHPTIGIGFDLTVTKVRNKVFTAMGIALGSPLASALTTATNNSTGQITPVIQANLNAAYGKAFVMNQRGQHRILFNTSKTKPCHAAHALS